MSQLEKMMQSIQVTDSKYKYNGNTVPRVTHILSLIHDEYLMKWANSLGFRHKNYMDERDAAAAYGSVTHSAIEMYLKDKEPEETNLAYEGFLLWWNTVVTEGNQIEIIGQEESLSNEYYGGTYDLLVKINGCIYLVDFKTSNHIGYKYMLQLAAYRNLIRINKGIEISGCIILQLGKKSIYFNEYFVDLSRPDHLTFINDCETTFNHLAITYWMVEYIRQTCDCTNFLS